MNLEIVNLLEEEIQSLLLSKSIETRLAFHEKGFYLFFHKNQVYGLYQCHSLSGSKTVFRHNGYLPCYYYASSKNLDANLAFYLLRQENKDTSTLSIQSSLEKDCASFFWHSFEEKELIQKESLYFDQEIKEILAFHKSLERLQRSALIENLLKDYGKYLYNQFSPSFKEALSKSNYLTLSGDFSFIFYSLHDGEAFISQRKRIKEHAVISQERNSAHISKGLFLLLLNSRRHDPEMKAEYESLIQEFRKFKINFPSLFSPLNKVSLAKLLESVHFLHYIGHIEKEGIPLENGVFFEASDLKKLSSVPKVLILSSCYGLSREFKETFFKKGGKTLVYFNENIDSHHMKEVFQSFYWQFFVRRSKIEEIILSIRRKFYKNNLNWMHLRLMGKGDLRYKGN